MNLSLFRYNISFLLGIEWFPSPLDYLNSEFVTNIPVFIFTLNSEPTILY